MKLNDLKEKIKDDHKEKLRKIHQDFEDNMLTSFKNNLGITDEEYRAVNFISMLIYSCEKSVEKACGFVIKKGVISPLTNEMIDFAFGELTFTSKIKLYEKILKKYPSQYKDLINGLSFYRELNSIRNQIFHCKLNKVTYKNKSIIKSETKMLMIKDMLKACGVETKKPTSQRALASEAYFKKTNKQ